MVSLSHNLQLVLVTLAGWINQQPREVIDYFQEKIAALHASGVPL
jgi:hypothetical protein